MSRITVGPTGNTVQGNVLDASKLHLERKLQDHDPLLYLKWNPRKLYGHGCWEIRRKPELKSIREVVFFQGNTYTIIEPVELNMVNHVLDVAFINYALLSKIKRMDTWQQSDRGKDWGHEFEYDEAKAMEAEEERSAQTLTYVANQHKSEIRDFKNLVLSGMNPAQIADHWGKKQGQ